MHIKQMLNCAVAGGLMKMNNIDEELLTGVLASQPSDIRKVHRVQVNGEKLYCEEYSRMTRRVCDVVCCKNADILKITYFVVNNTSKVVYAVARKLLIEENCFINDIGARHIIKVKKSLQRVVVPVDIIKEKLFFIKVRDEMYIAKMSNLLGHSIFK